MKKVIYLLIVTLFLSTGCSFKNPLEGEALEFAEKQNETNVTLVQGCRSWVHEEQMMDSKMFEAIPQAQKVFAAMHRDTMKMVSRVFGDAPVDPCKPGTNVWDAYIAYVEESGKTSRAAISETGQTLRHGSTVGGLAYGAGRIADAVGDRIGGDKVTGGRDVQRSGRDMNLTGNVDSDTKTNSVLTQAQITRDGNPTMEPATSTATIQPVAPMEPMEPEAE